MLFVLFTAQPMPAACPLEFHVRQARRSGQSRVLMTTFFLAANVRLQGGKPLASGIKSTVSKPLASGILSSFVRPSSLLLRAFVAVLAESLRGLLAFSPVVAWKTPELPCFQVNVTLALHLHNPAPSNGFRSTPLEPLAFGPACSPMAIRCWRLTPTWTRDCPFFGRAVSTT